MSSDDLDRFGGLLHGREYEVRIHVGTGLHTVHNPSGYDLPRRRPSTNEEEAPT